MKRLHSTRRTGRKVATLRYLPNGLMLALEAPYNRDFLSTMRASIPTKKRIWDGDDKTWYVVRDQFDKLCHLLDQYYDETLLLDFPAQEVSASSWAKLWLVEGAPLDVVRAVYKVLARKHHPDVGGDASAMQTINDAYRDILGELKNGD